MSCGDFWCPRRAGLTFACQSIEQAEVAEAVLGHRQHPLVSMRPSVLGETDLLELKATDQRSCRGSQHHLVKIHAHALCSALTACQAVL